jgi:hypothetical protein
MRHWHWRAISCPPALARRCPASVPSARGFFLPHHALVLGTVAVEPERDEDGSVHIWRDPRVLAKLKALRGPGESYSRLDHPRCARRTAISRREGPASGLPPQTLPTIQALPEPFRRVIPFPHFQTIATHRADANSQSHASMPTLLPSPPITSRIPRWNVGKLADLTRHSH